MRKIYLLLILAILFSKINAQTIHTFIFANTQDVKIGESCRIDKDHMLLELKTISRILGYRLDEHIYTDGNFNFDNAKKSINALECSENDIVIFYYTGHGARAIDDNSIWPQMSFNRNGENLDKNYLSLLTVQKIIESKKPRLRIIIADCCNNTSRALTPKLVNKGQTVVPNEDMPTKVYNKLYNEIDGSIIVSSCMPNEFSIATEEGGLYTLSFLKSMETALNDEIESNWKALLDDSKHRTIEFVKNNNISSQTPQYEINIHKRNNPNPNPEPTDDYMKLITSLLDKNKTISQRIALIEPINEKVFASNATVETIGRDAKTIVDSESSIMFVKRLAISANISNIVEVEKAENTNGKIKLLKVHEIRISKSR